MVGFYDIWERENRGGRSGGEQSEKETFAWELINLIWLITCSFHTSEVGAKAEAFLGSLKFPTLPFYTYNLFMITWYDFQLRTHQSILPTILYLTSFRPTPSLLTSINLNPIGYLTMYPSYVLISSLSLISLTLIQPSHRWNSHLLDKIYGVFDSRNVRLSLIIGLWRCMIMIWNIKYAMLSLFGLFGWNERFWCLIDKMQDHLKAYFY